MKGDDRTISTKASFTITLKPDLVQFNPEILKLLFGPEWPLAVTFSMLYNPGWIWNERNL